MAYLVLSNGKVYEGKRIGAHIDQCGELVFTTGMVGYMETLTDPSYAGQIVIQTFPMIGNYGFISEDYEGSSAVSGYIVRELCDHPSNFRSEGSLDQFLKEHGIPGLCGIDTRDITRTIREEGVMNAAILDAIPDDMSFLLKNFTVHAVSRVSTEHRMIYPAIHKQKYHVVLIDYGAKRGIIRCLCERGCKVTVVPHDTSADEILSLEPDGIMLSNGPGDPTENQYEITQISKLIGQKPIFGICLGHQLMALALGGKTTKLKYGHRGGNQPVFEKKTGRTWITSQNHGYAVLADSLLGVGTESFVNANDGSCEGMEYPDKQCYTVQFHPEACAGPKDTSFLFDRLIQMMGGFEHA